MNNYEYLQQIRKAEADLRYLKRAFWNVRRHLTNNPDDLENAEHQLIEIKTLHDKTERKIKELNKEYDNALVLNSFVFARREPTRQPAQRRYIDPCINLDVLYDSSAGTLIVNGNDYCIIPDRR